MTRIKKTLLSAAFIAAINVEIIGQAAPQEPPKSILTHEESPVELVIEEEQNEPAATDKGAQGYIKDIPLDEEIQTYTYETAKEYGVPYNLILAIMQTESEFNTEAVSQTNDYGIMQINKVNHGWLNKIGIDAMTVKGNIKAGIVIISDLMHYEDLNLILMAYNHGEAGAKKKWTQGITESSYSKKVIAAYKEFEAQ